MEKRELVIIGAGPAGLSAAIYGKRAGLDTLVLEKGRPGGQVLITSKIENYPGILDGIKFRVTAEEKASLDLTCKLLNLSLSTFIRRAIHNVKIEKTVIVAGGGEETLTAVSTLLAQCSKVGINLNQLARHFNSGGADTEQIRAKILDELADLTAFRLHAEKVLGELYGNAQAYRL